MTTSPRLIEDPNSFDQGSPYVHQLTTNYNHTPIKKHSNNLTSEDIETIETALKVCKKSYSVADYELQDIDPDDMIPLFGLTGGLLLISLIIPIVVTCTYGLEVLFGNILNFSWLLFIPALYLEHRKYKQLQNRENELKNNRAEIKEQIKNYKKLLKG